MDIRNDNINIPGQISVFDLMQTVTNTKATRSLAKHFETNGKQIFTLSQKSAYKKYMATLKVLRVIFFCCGYLGIEVEKSESIITYCIDKKGIEFSFIGRTGVLPMDKIIYYSDFEIKETKTQKERLQDLIRSDKNMIKRVLKRKGDLNILIEERDKVLSILPNGWVLEFRTIKSVECANDEVVKVE